MHDRAGGSPDGTRTFTHYGRDPFVVVMVDEIAFLTAYQADRNLRKRTLAALATLTSKGGRSGTASWRAAGPAQGRAQPAEPVPHQDRAPARRDQPGGHGAWRRRPGPGRPGRPDLARCRTSARGSATSGSRPTPTRSGSAPLSSPTTTSARWPRRWATCRAMTDGETAWRTDEPCPVCCAGLVLVDDPAARPCGPMPPVRLRRTGRDRVRGRCLMSGRTRRQTRAERLAMPLARMWSTTWPSRTAAASSRCSSAAPSSTPAHSSKSLSPAGTPWRRSARRAPNGPGSCGPRSAARGGTWTRTRHRAGPAERGAASGGSAPLGGAGRPGRPASRRLDTGSWMSGSASWTSRSPTPGCAATSCPPGRAGTARPGAVRTPPAAPPPRSARTVGKTFTAPDGKTFRPSMFVTLTCPSYGRVGRRRTGRPGHLRLQSAARDALHFAALFDRFVQNLRRFVGYDLQYFAAVEPQRRLAPHVHVAIRGAISRAELREVLAATYHQVWWPTTAEVRFDGGICRSGMSHR